MSKNVNNYITEWYTKDNLRLLLLEHEKITMKMKEEEINNKELLVLYHEFLDSTRKLLKVFPDDIMLLPFIIESLLFKGVFSDGEKFYSNTKDVPELEYKSGISVINGQGCCRHVARFVNDLVHLDLFYCYQNKFLLLKEKPANHVINLIRKDNVLYGYDVLNSQFYRFTHPTILSVVNDYISSRLLYKPYADIKYQGYSFNDIAEFIREAMESVHKCSITDYDVRGYRSWAADLYRQEQTTIDNYCEKERSLKKEIALKLKKNLN